MSDESERRPEHAASDGRSERGSDARGAGAAAARTHRRSRSTRSRSWRSCSWPRCSCCSARHASWIVGRRRPGPSPASPGSFRRPAPRQQAARARHLVRPVAPVSERTRRAARQSPPPPAIPCSSAPATSGGATRTTTRTPRPCSTGSRGPCSRPATTPTRPARRSSSAIATTPAGAAIATGPGRLPATTTGRRRGSLATSTTSGTPRRDRAGRRGTRTTSGAGTSSCSTRRARRSTAAIQHRRRVRWLAADLAANRAACTLAIFHHPRFSSGDHGDAPAMDAFWRPLYAAGVDVIVNGHDHDYERFAPQDPDGQVDGDRGIRQFVVGTGGAPLRDFTRVAPNSELRAIIGHGVLALTLRGELLRMGLHRGRRPTSATAGRRPATDGDRVRGRRPARAGDVRPGDVAERALERRRRRRSRAVDRSARPRTRRSRRRAC